jgi:uncharacterized membrane protein (UPF0127 family)
MFRTALGAVVLFAALTAASARASSPSVVAACANPALPPEILKRPPGETAAPLGVVAAPGALKSLRLAVAADSPSRELGLMCVTGLRPQHGMLFVFPVAARQPFWMKNTLIPLDMIWLDADGKVTTVAADVPASTRTTPDAGVARRTGFGRFVIELAAGEARTDGIAVGTTFSLPELRSSP